MPKNNVSDLITDEQIAEDLRRFNLAREQVLARLWEIANLSPEMTRNSVTGQVKALSMIIAIEGLIPGKMTDGRAGSSEKKAAPPPNPPQIYQSAWLRGQQAETAGPRPNPAPAPDAQGDQEEDGRGVTPAAGESASASNMQARPHGAFAPDTRVPFSIPKNRFGPRR